MKDIDRAVKEAVASFEIEGFEISDDVVELAQKLYSGDISYDEYFKQIIFLNHLDNAVSNRSCNSLLL